MSCVNINSKEFKKLVEDTGISAGNLELIIHDYQNNQGNEGEYPSIEYIMNKLTGTNKVSSDAQVELWEKKYSTPKVFKDKHSLEAAVSEASRYYSKEAITTWENNEGNYVMKVAEPQLSGEAVEREYERILANAPRDKEGKLLAPNGRPSNLNERQYAQVRSKAFKRWFGDWINDPDNASKVVDENGEPLVMIHNSTISGITMFKPNVRNAIFFADRVAQNYVSGFERGKYDYEVFLNIKNPYTDSYEAAYIDETEGIDGVFVSAEVKEGIGHAAIVKNPNQIKSATDNVGTFETREDNIYYDKLPTSYKDSRDTALWNLFESNKDKESITIEAEASIVDIIDRIKDSEYSSIIELLKYKFGNRKLGTKLLSGIKVKLINPINVIGGYDNSSFKSLNFQGRRAYYNASDKTIYINVVANYNNGNSSGVLLHELMHALTVDRILSNSESKTKFEEILKDYQNSNFDSRYKEGEAHKLEEFIANIWTDPITIENLKRIKSTRTNQSLWEEIKNFFNSIISKLFNDVPNDSLMAEASNELIKLLESPIIVQSKDTFKENLSTPKKETFYSEREVNQFIKDLKEYEDYSDNDIKVQYFESTEDLDEYWEVTYGKSSTTSNTETKTIEYTPTGKERQTYTIVGNRIYNKKGEEVFKDESVDRNKIFGNLAVQEGRAVVVTYRDAKYVVNNKNAIMSVTSGKVMQWGEENGDRKKILALAQVEFNKRSTLTNNTSINTIANNTASYGVIIDPQLKQHVEQFHTKHPQGIIAYRVNFNAYNTAEEVNKGHIGNPFSEGAGQQNKGKDTVQKFYDWLITGNNFGNTKATEEFRQAIINKILNTPVNSPILYYTELNRPSHATVIGYLVNNKYLLNTNNTQSSTASTQSTQNQKVQEYSREWGRSDVEADTESLYIFTDNTDRDSGSGKVNPNSKYAKKYGVDKHYPTMTQAVIRGLDNAMPISTQRWYHQGAKGTTGRWTDDAFEEFKTTIDAEIEAIKQEWDTGNYKRVVIGSKSGFFNTRISNISKERVPQIHDYLEQKLNELYDYIENSKPTQNQPVEESPTQEENTEESTQSSNEEFAKESQSITEQIDNLLDSNIILASEVRHIAEQIVYTISDIITECQTIPGRMVELFGDRFKDFDAENATRVEIAKKIGPNDLIKFAKLRFKDFDSSNTEGNKASYKTLKKARLILQNWKALMYLATDVFANVENFTIVGNEVREDINADADNFNESNNQDDIGEVEGDTQEHWQIETKTLDVLSSMSQLVRQALLKCYLLETTTDSDGNVTYKKVKSEFNIDERVNPRDATNSILRWVQGSITLEDMITKLQTKVDSNPWVSQLIDRLTDTSGKESDFQSQFFGVFNKHFQSYSVVTKEDGVYKSIIVNEFPALREAYNSITTQYKIGEHPMFGLNGVNKKTFEEFKETYKDLLPYRSKFENAYLQEVSRLLAFAYNALGYYVNPEMVASSLDDKTFKKMLDYMDYMIKSIESNIDNKDYDPFKFKAEGSISKNVREFLRPITDKLEDTAVSSFYDSGKMYQSYITPSYMTKLMNKFNLKGDEFDAFIEDEYGKYKWFKYKSRNIEKGWRNTWLELLVTDGNAREIFKHKVQLNFNKHNYMKNMNDTEYTLSLLAEYYSETADAKQSRVPAWFRVPMLSNKPSSEFIKFYSERGVNYKETITKGLKMVFDQELSRIQTVNMRAFNKKDARFIKNFEINGKKFNFLDFMNDYLTGKSKDSELGKLIKAKVNGTRLTPEQEITLNELALEAIREAMDNKVESVMEQWKNSGILEGAKQIENIGKEDSEVEEKLINFIWNDTFAAMNIIQLTVTDIAYYKDAEDLQKRLAQIHAPGVRAYVEAKDYDGNRVTDGYERTIYLKDFDSFKSNIIENVNIVFERKINSAKTEQEKSTLIALKESLTKEPVYNEKGEEVERGGAYWYINVADAQGFNSPTSYRKKAIVFGKWSKKAEELYQNLKSGNYKYSDLQVAFQPLKPFVYSQIDKSSNVEGAPLSTLKVPVQNKNSEYLLIMADAILQGEDTGRPNLLRAIFEIMEESAKADNTKGIDTVQFESTVKSGLMGAIDINKFQYAEDGEAKAKAAMRAAIYANGKDGEYNNSVVHKIPFEDYCLQQEVPAHFRNHEQAHGSQIRFIIPSDLEETNYLGEAVTYEVEERQLTAEEFKSEYEDTIAANINSSIETLSTELHLTGSLKDRNIALSKILQREIIQSPRYGVDLLQACSVDENGNFRIPLGDPIQSKRVEQLINSIIKNRVNKQTIAGGPVVQVSNFGTSRELNIRFKSKEKDKNGNPLLLKTRKEFEGTDEQFKEYISKNQAGIAYFEVFAPIYTNEIFTKFQNPDGSIDIEAVEALHPDLLKMVGYRIPTEDKYSMAPLKIVGFLPREAGEGIMMPNDITLLTGSDFDVDKMYLMIKELPIHEKPRKEIFDKMYSRLVESKEGAKYEDKQKIKEALNMFLDNPQVMKNVDALNQYMWKLYMREAYIVKAPTEGTSYRNNKIVDMTYEVLTHETTADKILNPGGFDPQKKMGYMVSAFKNPSNNLSWEELNTKSIEDLKDLSYTDKNLCYIDVHTQFYKQNNAAGALIGMFAVHKVAHAVLESNGYMLDVDSICSLTEPFFIAGMEFGGYMQFDSKYDKKGQLIGKSLGCLVASAVDAVKDPVLNLMNINGNTATILNALIRMGMPFEDAALFLSQSSISNALSTYNKENITNYTKLSDIIAKRINDLESKFDIDYTSQINSEPLTKEELIEGIKDNPRAEIEYKVLKAFQRIQKISEALKGPTFATRFNSISSAVGPLIIDNLIIEHKLEQFSDHIIGPNGKNIDITDILKRHPILGQFYRTIGIAKYLFRNMPANSTGFRKILDSMDDDISNLIFSDRKLLSSLSDFYQSYLMIASGAIKENQLDNYIKGFPAWFFKENFKEKYKDNALIQAIKLDINKNTGRAVLKLDITGLDTQQKEVLSNAWIDIHKKDPELSIKLFTYNFFRKGVGFSPKTFMSLVPTYVKERIPGYIETYKNLPQVSPEVVLDQFIRNNWDNNKLVPKKSVKYKKHSSNKLEIYKEDEVKEMSKVPYFKMSSNGVDTLWKQIGKTETAVYYEEINPLGNNGEYLEISTSFITKAKEIPVVAKESQDKEQLNNLSRQDLEFNDSPSTIPSNYDVINNLELLYKVIENGKTVTSREQAINKVNEYKNKSQSEQKSLEKGKKKFIRNRFEKLNITFDENKVDEIYKLMC
jgi:hypothetical protein